MGKPLNDVMDMFLKDLEDSHIIVGHNIAFDINMVAVEMLRLKRKETLKNHAKIVYCTQNKGLCFTDYHYISKFNGQRKQKPPKLMELHDTLFNSIPKNLHNAFTDILVCFRCMFYMIYKVDPLKNNIMINLKTSFRIITHPFKMLVFMCLEEPLVIRALF